MRLPGPRLDIGQSLVGYTLQFNDESLWEIYPQQEMSFAGYRTVPRLDIPCSSYLAVQLLSTPLFIDLDILVSQSLVMFVMFICLLSIVYLSMAFDQLELISGGQAGTVTVS